MILERGNIYTINKKHGAICQNCTRDISDKVDGRVVMYLGILNGVEHLFLYDNPFQCECGKTHRYHLEQPEMFDVTEEFRKLLDKK